MDEAEVLKEYNVRSFVRNHTGAGAFASLLGVILFLRLIFRDPHEYRHNQVA